MLDRKLVCLVMLAATAAQAENWVVLRPVPTGYGQPPGILIDTDSIVVFESGLRQARTKLDFLGRWDATPLEPNALTFMEFVEAYDCAKDRKQNVASIATLADGSRNSRLNPNRSNWSPHASNPAADPAFGYVCQWPAPVRVPDHSSGG